MGTFKRGEVKVRPGVYHRYENSGGSRVAEARNGIGAGLITAKWGPLNQIVEMDLFSVPAAQRTLSRKCLPEAYRPENS